MASVSGSTVTLNWTASSGSPAPTGYTLYRGIVHGGPYQIVKTALTTTSTTDSPANGTYFYTVTAFLGGFVSSISGNGSTAIVTCSSACAFPTGTAFTIFGNSVTQYNGTFIHQPANNYHFHLRIVNVWTGNRWRGWLQSESAKSNEVQATVPAVKVLHCLLLPVLLLRLPWNNQPISVVYFHQHIGAEPRNHRQLICWWQLWRF
jgi:hypothetical protein